MKKTKKAMTLPPRVAVMPGRNTNTQIRAIHSPMNETRIIGFSISPTLFRLCASLSQRANVSDHGLDLVRFHRRAIFGHLAFTLFDHVSEILIRHFRYFRVREAPHFRGFARRSISFTVCPMARSAFLLIDRRALVVGLGRLGE